MRRFACTVALVGAVAHVALAVPWDGPRPTTEADAALGRLGWSPNPTQAAMMDMNAMRGPRSVPEFPVRGLERRLAGHSTCGYQDGQIGDAIYCSPGHYCASDTVKFVEECCPITGVCYFPTTCYPYTQYATCISCESDTSAYFCTGGSLYPSSTECATLLFDKGGGTTYSKFQCDSLSGVTIVEPTYTNPVLSPTSSTTHFSTPSSTTASSSSTSTSPVPTTTAPVSSGSKTPVGAIAGGVVGGVAVLAALVAFLAWMRHKNKRDGEKPNPQTNVPAAPMGGPGHMGQGSPAPPYGHVSEVEGTGPTGGSYFAGAAVAEKDAGQHLHSANSPGYTSVAAKASGPGSGGLSPGGLSSGGLSPVGVSPQQHHAQPIQTGPLEMGDNREVHELA